jgi:succinate dehydrogenase / fumarate reductase cytochrome b subunit
MANVERPISPHLQIYKWQITSVLSILHRITGAALGIGALLLAWWLLAAASGPHAFAVAQGFIASWLGRLILLGFSWALFFHLCNGIRHLAWDAGYGFDLPTVERTGWLVVIGSAALTLLAWFIGYGLRG